MSSLYDHEPVEVWSFQRRQDLESWQVLRADRRMEIAAGALIVESSASNPALQVRSEHETETVDGLTLDVRGLVRRIWVQWAADGALFDAANRVELEIPWDSRQTRRRLYVSLADDPSWRGRFDWLRITFSAPQDATVEIYEISLDRRRLNGSRTARSSQRPWRASIDGIERSALLSLPGQDHSKRFSIESGDRLELSIAAESAMRFEVVATGAGSEATVLGRREIPSGAPFTWSDWSLPLGSVAGEEVALTLRSERIGPADQEAEPRGGPAAAIAFWGSPQLVSKSRPGKAPNVLLVVVDTLRADALSIYGDGHSISPQIDRWFAGAGTRFEDVLAPAPWTLPSHVTLFSGLDALSHPVEGPEAVPEEMTLLAERLRDAGYQTLAVTGGMFLGPEYGLSQGFDAFSYWQEMHGPEELRRGAARVDEWLSRYRDRPFFLFWHTYRVHDPYESDLPPSPGEPQRIWVAKLPDDQAFYGLARRGWRLSFPDRQEVVRAHGASALTRSVYEAGVRAVDAEVGRILSRLRAEGLADSTVVVLTADHGEMLGEHDFTGHGFLWEENLKVPLLISDPRRETVSKVEAAVGLVDVTPTILDLVGLPLPEEMDGVSLAGALQGADVPQRDLWSYAGNTAEGVSIRLPGRLKYVLADNAWQHDLVPPRLFDLGRDPHESENLVAAQGRAAAELRRRAVRRLRGRPGFYVRLQGGKSGCYVELAGAAIERSNVKSLDAERRMTRTSDRSGEIRLAPGEVAEFNILWGIAGTLEVRLRLDEESHEASFDPSRVTGAFSLFYDGESWRDEFDQPLPAHAAGVSFSWVGAREERPTSLSVELEERLRAVGYLDN